MVLKTAQDFLNDHRGTTCQSQGNSIAVSVSHLSPSTGCTSNENISTNHTPSAETLQRPITASGQATGIVNAENEARPSRTEYASLPRRLNSFREWGKDHIVSPTELALNGFFYSGYGDCVRCFFCGGGLHSWKYEDDVCVEHARWYPGCAHNREQMSSIFIDTVLWLYTSNNHVTFPMVLEKLPIEVIERIASLTSTIRNVHFHYDLHRHVNARLCFRMDCPMISNCSLYPQYSRAEDRCLTFGRQNKNTVALAGYFFSSGPGTHICFHCGDKKLAINREDNLFLVLMDHARTSPHCDFIRSRHLLSDSCILLAQCKIFRALPVYLGNIGKNIRKAIKREPLLDTTLHDYFDTLAVNNICSFCRRTPVTWRLFCCGSVSCDNCLAGRRHCPCGSQLKRNHPLYIT